MKILGTILITILLFSQNVLAQPMEYKGGSPSFCQRMFKYICQKPNFGEPKHRRMVRTRSIMNGSSDAPLPEPLKPQIKLTRSLPAIDSVFIRGGVDLQIMGGGCQNKISVKCPYPDLAVRACNGSLYISYTKPVNCNQNSRPHIKLYVNQLRQLIVAGNSCITGRQLNTPCGLVIEHCGGGCVCLEGPIHLVRVVNSGSACITIHDVISDHVHLLATGYSNIDLRGSTGLLLIRAFQHATVNTRCLYSCTAMVQAADESFVAVRARGVLRAFASGMSNVYYYTKPGELFQHNVLSGNVFNMSS